MKTSGYCISCSIKVDFDINDVICADCIASVKREQKNWVSGRHCHCCGREQSQISNFYPICRDCSPFDRTDNRLDEYYNLWVLKYREMSTKEKLLIAPLWNTDYTVMKFGLDYYILRENKTDELLQLLGATSDLNTSDIFDNCPKSNRKIMNVLRAWQHEDVFLPPTISLDGGKHFNDGRHRILANAFLERELMQVYEKTNKRKTVPTII